MSWRSCTKSKPCAICANGEPARQRCSYTDNGARCCFRSGGTALSGWRIVKPFNSSTGGTIYRADDGAVHTQADPFTLDYQRRKSVAKHLCDAARARGIWNAAATSSPVMSAYFHRRGVNPLSLPDSLRFAQSIACFIDGVDVPGPAIIAEGVDQNGQLQCVHRIYLDHSQPTKRDIESPKRLLGSPKGAAVRLARGTPTSHIVICEGVETGVALFSFVPNCEVWACISGSGMQSVEFSAVTLATLRKVTVAADCDAADLLRGFRPGLRFAMTAATRLRTLYGIPVRIAVPSHESHPSLVTSEGDPIKGKSTDWEDVYAAFGSSAIDSFNQET